VKPFIADHPVSFPVLLDPGQKVNELFRVQGIPKSYLYDRQGNLVAQAIDMQDLAPCRPAAARFCERSGGMTWSNLLRCGATLAAHSFRVGDSCREVLRRYGQL